MALVFIPQWTLDFQSENGPERIDWEVDILRSYEDTSPTPAWASTSPKQLVGTNNPIEVEWQKDYDIYKPINGSSATLNLVVSEPGQYPDFSDAGEFEYQLRLRYRGDVISDQDHTFAAQASSEPSGVTLAVPGDDIVTVLDVTAPANGIFPPRNYAFTVSGNNVTITEAVNAGDVITVRYTTAAEGMVDYWCGFMSAIDGQEHVSTFPFNISFKATDNLALLEDSSVDTPIVEAQTNVFTHILDALYQTGLDLPVYVDSGIRITAGDALPNITVSNFAFWNDDKTELWTRKELIEGTLSALNCKIRQSGGVWRISNASTYGGSGTNEVQTWLRYNVPTGGTAYAADSTFTETLRVDLPTVVRPVYDDLQLNTRRPYGSVEARPQDLTPVQHVRNGGFENGLTGWQTDGSLGALTLSTTALSNGMSISTDKNRYQLNGKGEQWFRNSSGWAIDTTTPSTFRFDWRYDDRTSGSGIDNARIVYGFYAVLPSAVTRSTLNLSLGNLFSGNVVQDTSSNIVRWDFTNEHWELSTLNHDPTGSTKSWVNFNFKSVESSEPGEWREESYQLAPLNETGGLFGSSPLPANAQLFVEFYYPTAKADSRGRNRGNSSSELFMYVDNLELVNDFATDEISPVFERVQDKYNTTDSYTPRIASGTSSSIYQTLPQKQYWRDGNTTEQASPVSLERLVTQQKLNDFNKQFKYYEGSLINLTKVPLHPHNKVLVNFSNFAETTSAIFNGGTFKPKKNVFEVDVYIPQQETDIASGDGVITNGVVTTYGFFEENVNLVAASYPGRSKVVTYTLGVQSVGLDDVGDPIPTVDENGVQPGQPGYINTTMSMVPTEPFITVSGLPGQVIKHKITLTPAPGFELSASNLTIRDDDNTPEQISFSNIAEFVDAGTAVELPIEITIPEVPEYEQLYVSGEVDPFIADNREFNLTFSLNAITNAVITSSMVALRGPVGSVSFANVLISPSIGHQLTASTFNVVGTLPTGVNLLGFSQFGTSVFAEFAVTFQATNQTEAVVLTGDNAALITGGVDTAVVTLDLTENITNVSTISDFAVTGVVGTTSQFNLPLYAADGYELDSDTFSATIAAAPTNIEMYDAIGGGDSVQIPLRITFPAADQSVAITLNGAATLIGAETVDYTLNFVNNIPNSNLTETSETFTLPPGTRFNYNNALALSTGYRLASNPTIVESGDAQANVAFSAQPVGRDFFNLSTSILIPSVDAQTTTLTLSGTPALEPYQLLIDTNAMGLNNSIVSGSFRRNFAVDDAGNTVTATFQIVGTGDFAYKATDVPTVVSQIGAVETITAADDFGGGIWTISVVYTIPAAANIGDLFDTLTVTGTPSAVVTADDNVDVTLNFTDDVDNGAPQVPSVTLSGLPGTSATYYAITVPDAGFRVAAGNITTTDSSVITAIAADVSTGLNVVTPITVTFPSVDTSVTLTVDGDATAVAVGTQTYTLTVTGSGSNFSIPDFTTPNVFEGVAGQHIEANIFVQSNTGYQITAIGSIVAPTGVTAGSPTIVGDGAIIPITVDIGAATSGTLTFTPTVAIEPYTLTVNIDGSALNEAFTTTGAVTARFGGDDLNTNITGLVTQIRPAEGSRGFNVAPVLSGTGITVTNSTLNANGSVTYTFSAAISGVEGDQVLNASFASATPGVQPATNGTLGFDGRVFNSRERFDFSIPVTANGSWTVVSSSGVVQITAVRGGFSGTDGYAVGYLLPGPDTELDITLTMHPTDLFAGAVDTSVILDTSVITRRGITVSNAVNAQAVDGISIVVDIGGTPGSDANTLYIT